MVRVGQHRLPQVNVRVPERELALGVRFNHHLVKWIMKIQDVAEIEILGRENRIEKEQYAC